MTNALIPIDNERMIAASKVADRVASEGIFYDYQQRTAENTLRRQRADLRRFALYLAHAQIIQQDADAIRYYAEQLETTPYQWQTVTWGLIAGFREWALAQGDAVGSVNVRLATLKRYVELAYQSGTMTTEAYTMIRTVKGYGKKHQRKVDEKRPQTRQTSAKKAAAIIVPHKLARELKAQPDTPQGRRDAVLMCLLLDHGLRCGEVVGLTVGNVDLKAKTLTFYRQKVSLETTHKLSADTLRALKAYMQHDEAPMSDDPLLLGSTKGGKLNTVRRFETRVVGGMSERAVNERVGFLARKLGATEIAHLSPHDCRHTAATYYARKGVPIDDLQSWGGWSSLAMPMHYVERSVIANEGMEGIDLYAD